jgi:hypothetical protein
VTINSVYGEEFAGSQHFKAFTSVAFDLVPLGIFLNAPGAFGYPLATWGTPLKFEPIESFYAMVGCYNGMRSGSTRRAASVTSGGGKPGVRRGLAASAGGWSPPGTADDYPGTSSSVVAARCGSAKPRTHFSDAFVLYFSA